MRELVEAHYHWKFLATNTGNINPVEITVIGHFTEDQALDAVKPLVNRENYRLVMVWECTTCKYQDSILKVFRKIFKIS